MTDQELVALVMDEGRAHLATVRNAERYDAGEAGALDNGLGLLHEWNTAREKVRAAVMERLEGELMSRPVAQALEGMFSTRRAS